jgi:hypothetical protein
MRLREAHVPILLWVCAAAMIHLGGVQQGEHAMVLEEGKSSLRQLARSLATPVSGDEEYSTTEVELTEDLALPAPVAEPAPAASTESSAAPLPSTKPKPDEKLPEPPKAKPEPKKPPPPPPVPKKPEEPKIAAKPPAAAPPPPPVPKKPEEPKPEEPKVAAKPPPPPPPPPELDKKIAVQQIQKKDEEKNEAAKLLAEKNHHVKPGEETQASVTSLTENNPDPNPGTNSSGPSTSMGNGAKSVAAQDEDRAGEKVAPNVLKQPAPKAAIPDPPKSAVVTPPPGQPSPEPPGTPKSASAQGPQAPPANLPPQGTGAKGPPPAAAPKAPDTMAGPNGVGTIPKPSAPGVATLPSSTPPGANGNGLPKYKLPELPAMAGGNKWVDGLGSNYAGKSGSPAGLTPNIIAGAVGQPQIDKLRVAEAETRLSKHRGEFKSALLERWKPAIENYVPGVRAGNQTNLGTRASPFATYLTQIHNRLHPVFSEGFVDNLGDLPKESILRDTTLVAWMEIVLKPDGTIHHLGIVKASGSTVFDIAALDSVDRSAPFGTAPKEIVSPDGLIYLHWEFHNDVERCSTANARPYILDDSTKPKLPADPPKAPTPPTTEKKTGALLDRRRM